MCPNSLLYGAQTIVDHKNPAGREAYRLLREKTLLSGFLLPRVPSAQQSLASPEDISLFWNIQHTVESQRICPITLGIRNVCICSPLSFLLFANRLTSLNYSACHITIADCLFCILRELFMKLEQRENKKQWFEVQEATCGLLKILREWKTTV